ncbi:MAG TPA: NfeD family protein, partial [Pirellulales bacterium]|nr:NfeD family protein [Pirellulales bacterium]
MDPTIWASLLLLLGLVLALVEMFVPSGGILGFLSLAAMMGSIIMAFSMGGVRTGFSFVIATAVALPSVLILGFKFWPHTPMGKRIMLSIPSEAQVKPESNLKDLLGKVGKAKSVMLLSGSIEIDGRIIDAVSEGMAIDKGEWVQVIDVRANRVVVRPAEA